jgi:hypothetical protein
MTLEVSRKTRRRWPLLVPVLAMAVTIVSARVADADSPELAMREFASGQIKKGVRSIGFGGDGATWGNYGLVWRDADTALVDYGDTSYAGGNDFHFVAAGATTPSLWHGLAIYMIAMKEDTNDLHFNLKSPALGTPAAPVGGQGSDEAFFSKIAMPLGHGVSAGVLLAHETSRFDAVSLAGPHSTVHYDTQYRPSGGVGVAWQPDSRLLFGVRALFNNDLERRVDATGANEGFARSAEYRVGGSYSPWEGALIDMGGTRLDRHNSIANTQTTMYEPNVGFEQALLGRRLTFRLGVDESSPTAGISLRMKPINVDVAYVRNMARARVGELFGDRSSSIVATFTLDYRALAAAR